MSWTDRVVEYPNRVKLTPVSGQTNVYDMTMEEGEVDEEGTLLNSANLIEETNNLIDARLGGNIAPNNIKVGKCTLTGTHNAGTTYSKNVTFDTPFDTVPTVTVTPHSSSPKNLNVSIGSVTASGFTIYVYTATKRTSSLTVGWMATAL